MKLNLILSKNNWTSFHQIAFTYLLTDYFNIVYIEDGAIPSQHDSLLVSNLTDKEPWYDTLRQQGYRLVMDLLWGGSQFDVGDAFKLSSPNWFWYHESLLYQRKGYSHYVPNRTYNKKALMPMGIRKASSDLLYDNVTEFLDDFIYSYVERLGKRLPNDAPDNFWTSDPKQKTGFNQRFFNPEWYDQTYFSLVVETSIDDSFPLHITEKSFKPIAFQHPFQLWAQCGVLAHLKSLGFETYDNLFDESYDSEKNTIKRLNTLVDNIRNFPYEKFNDITNQKIQHNQNLFFNLDTIKTRIKQEIVDPMIDFFEKH